MARVGLSSLPILAAAVLIALPPSAALAGAPTQKKDDSGFSMKHFGEDPNDQGPITPDQGDFQESGPHHGTQPNKPDPPTIVEPAPTNSSQVSGPNDAVPVGPVVRPGSEARPLPQGGMPRPVPATPAKTPSSRDKVSVEPAGLRDAPAPQNPRLYSLWAGLSTPLLLPSAKVKSLSPDSAKTLSRVDYDEHILGDRSPVAGGAILGGPKDVPGSRAPASAGDGLYVTVELDVSATPGRYAATAAGLRDNAGLRLDGAVPPVFLNQERTRVALRGWLPTERVSDALSSRGVSRLELARPFSPAMREPSVDMTEILLGLRIEPRSEPQAILQETVSRLSQRTRFEFSRTIGYQSIPGTREKVLIIAGRVPVRDVGKILADGSVVKVAPAPKTDAPPSRKPAFGLESFLPYAVTRHPVLFFAALVLTMLLFGPAVRRRGR
ncbi:MAG: hypothetical protein WC728_10130 [Elusimicrobiota bacterium]